VSQIKIDNIEKLLRSEPSEKLLIKAIKGLKSNKKNWKSRTILTVICIILGIMIGTHANTVSIFQEAIDAILNVSLAIFGIIFTGYALLQAFMNKQLLIQLISNTKKGGAEEKSSLQDINENFAYLMILYTLAVVITLILKIVMLCVPNELAILEDLYINNAIASFAIILYFEFIGIILWRTIGFISTIYQLFNAYAVTQIIEILDEEPDD